jgi:hypothetical protein
VRRWLIVGGVTMALAATIAAAAQSKGRLSMKAVQAKGRPGSVVVTVRSQERLSGLRLVAVAPRVAVMDVVAATTQGGASATPRTVEIPRDGFARLMTRTDPYTWRVRVTLNSPGVWRLVIPNWNLQGYAMPLPLVRTLRVRG